MYRESLPKCKQHSRQREQQYRGTVPIQHIFSQCLQGKAHRLVNSTNTGIPQNHKLLVSLQEERMEWNVVKSKDQLEYLICHATKHKHLVYRHGKPTQDFRSKEVTSADLHLLECVLGSDHSPRLQKTTEKLSFIQQTKRCCHTHDLIKSSLQLHELTGTDPRS